MLLANFKSKPQPNLVPPDVIEATKRHCKCLASEFEARKVKSLSQEDLALEAGIDPSYIGQVERGQRNPSFRKLCAISQIIGRDLGSLCRGLPFPSETF